jgi:putative polyhydroxyalkanoate system protein
MSEINISRQHGKTLQQARKAAKHLASEMEEDLDMTSTWEGDILSFQRPGVKGRMEVDANEVRIQVKLGLLFSAFKPVIEQEIHKFFDENFPA